jgi:glycosyltransferase involved in cell wall biosynthesis
MLLIDGELHPEGRIVSAVRVRLGEIEQDADAFGMPEPKRYGAGPRWWAMLAVPAGTPAGRRPLALIAEAGGETFELPLGELELVGAVSPPAETRMPAAPARVAICMATYEPPPEQLARQLDSIRAQGFTDWVCLISDDCSSPEAFAVLREQVGDDPRFVLSRSPERLGFYRNFERALRMVPAGAELVAFADQDDRWDPDKVGSLVQLLDANPGAALGYSDMRVANDAGEVLSETFWYLRRNSHDSIASLAIANTVTGAASMFRRELLDVGLPFPPGHPDQHPYHDHWLALCALGMGEIAYLDRPTYDYTRHVDSVTVRQQPRWVAPPRGRRDAVRFRWHRLTRRFRRGTARPGGRAIYFKRYLLIRQFAGVLEMRIGERMAADKRRSLARLEDAESSWPAALALLLRSLRTLTGRTETMASERVLFLGLLWRRAVGRTARRRGRRPA